MNEIKRDLKTSQMLAELVSLRHTDFDAFMNLLYDALQRELSGAIFDQTPLTEKQEALNSMIQYFQDKEEYEKCAVLRDMVLTIE
jgi:hypothetical protein